MTAPASPVLSFRVLDHHFTLESVETQVRNDCAAALQRFADETPGAAPVAYRLVREISSDPTMPPYRLMFEDEWLFSDAGAGFLTDYLLWHIATTALTTFTAGVIIHAGSVVTPEGTGVLVPAASGSGKTTLTAGLVMAGCGYLSDEAAVLRWASTDVWAYPRPLNFKSGNPLVADARVSIGARRIGPTWHLDADCLRDDAVRSGPVAPRLVVVPEYRPDASPLVEPLTRGTALVALVHQVMNRASLAAGGFDLVVAAVRGARCIRVRYRNLDEGVELVLQEARRLSSTTPS